MQCKHPTYPGDLGVHRGLESLSEGAFRQCGPGRHPLEPETPMRRTPIHSYDIFDTLIARRCVHATDIFEAVERRSGVQGFKAHRIAAERAVAVGGYQLSDIYLELQKRLHLSEAETEALLQLEVQIELENVIPIVDNIEQLTNESILITDMYLPREVIREMLRAAGILQDLPILIGSHGKSTGELWQTLSEHGVQCIHMGDNTVSDIQNARQAGMRARHTGLSAPTEVETVLIGLGATEFATAMRAARLRVSRKGVPDWLYTLQMNVNVPFLLLSSLAILSEAINADTDKIFFSSRDGRNLQTAFTTLAGKLQRTAAINTEYWYTSRIARTRDSEDYLDYCRSSFTSRSMIVDLCGTGTSISALFQRIRPHSEPNIFLAQKVSDGAYAARMSKHYGLFSPADLIQVKSAFNTEDFIPNFILEELNYLPEGMVLDMKKTAYGFYPIRDPLEFEGEALDLIRAQHRLISDYFAVLSAEITEEMVHAFIKASSGLFGWLHQHAPMLKEELARLRSQIGVDDISNENCNFANLVKRQHARRPDTVFSSLPGEDPIKNSLGFDFWQPIASPT